MVKKLISLICWNFEEQTNIIHFGRQPNRQQEINDTDQRGFCPMPKDFPRESQKFFEVSISRSLISLSAPSRAHLKAKRQDRERAVECKYCDCVYVGQTSRATLDKNSLLSKHHMLHSHQINLESVAIVDRSTARRQRLIFEAWDSMRDRNAKNEHNATKHIQ